MISKGKRRLWDRLLIAAIAAEVILLVIICVSSVVSADDSSYELRSPVFYQGETVEGEDFIEPKSFVYGCRSTVVSSEGTSEPGTYSAEIRVEGNGGYSHDLDISYTVLPLIRESITLEAGFTAIAQKDIIADGAPEDVIKQVTPHITGELPPNDVPGDYEVTVKAGIETFTIPVTVVDTTPPAASPVSVVITNDTAEIEPQNFVTDITDATSVTCEFAEEYDFSDIKTFDVTVILTDAAGNTASVTSSADCRVDHTPPELSWEDDIFVTVGGTVSYLADIKKSDNSGGTVTCTVNADSVDYNTVGEYFVTYTATDEMGNSAEFTRRLCVVDELPPSKDEVLAMAKEIYDKIVTPDMSLWDTAYAIFRWTHDKIMYVGTGIDKSSWLRAARDGFKLRAGDCFTYMAVSRALLEVAGIPCTVVERDRHEGETRHYWLLVDIGDGWYHFDACSRRQCKAFVAFMRTDAELQWYRDNQDEHYYRFDPDAYPERSTNSYYSDILQQPEDISA